MKNILVWGCVAIAISICLISIVFDITALCFLGLAVCGIGMLINCWG
jgi:hypothetical protein